MNALRSPSKALAFARHRTRSCILDFKDRYFWDYYYKAVPEPKEESPVPMSEGHDEVVRQLKENGFDVVEYHIDVAGYQRYIQLANYGQYSGYKRGGKGPGFAEKSLEHYLSAELLGLCDKDVYLDVANAGSPTACIFPELYGCKAYRQDLIFPQGFHGDTIGGDAGSMPVEDGFADKMAMHCSFEHFEQDADIRFIREAGRVLNKGGKLCIIPLYLYKDYAIQTDPVVLPKDLPLERDAKLWCFRGLRNRHCRVYDIPHLLSRVVNNMGDLRLTIYVVNNQQEVDPSCYVRFIALFEKP